MTALVSRAPQNASFPYSTFVWTALFFLLSAHAYAVSCRPSQARRFPETNLPAAGKALDADKVDDAIQIYKKALLTNPGEPALYGALAEAYLVQLKSDDAEAELKTGVATHPHSAILETVLAKTQLQQGRPWDAQETLNRALADDPCYPEAHRTEGRLMEVISMYGSAARQYSLAHQLAPHDVDALYSFVSTFVPSQRVSEAQGFLDREKLDPESQTKLQKYIAQQKIDADALADCTLTASSPTSAMIPLLPLMANGKHMRAIGLNVDIDSHSTHLDVDTASDDGLVLSPTAAARTGLQYLGDTELHAIGGTDSVKAHRAIAKSVKIGPLEFHNCPVTVYDRKLLHAVTGRALDESYDGLIPVDLLRQFLITLDLPRGELKLAPLPSFPNAHAIPFALNTTLEWHDRYVSPEMSTYSLAYQVNKVLAVPTRITNDKNGQILLFVPETSAAHTTLTTDAARGIRKLQRDQYHETYGLAGTENDLYSVGRVNLEFAHIKLTANDTVAIDSKELGNVPGQNPMKISGLIGGNALRQCILHLDYRDGLVKLDYTPGPSRFFGVQ